MRGVPYKLQTDAWWLDGDINWRVPRQQHQPVVSLDRADGSVICDRHNRANSTADTHGEPHPYRR
jgi:hypothetical protein